jgi:MFS family permease
MPWLPASLVPMAQSLRRFPRAVWILFLGTFINKFGTFVLPFLGLHVHRLGYSTSQAGCVLGAYGAGHLAASLAGGHFADTVGRRTTIVISMFTGAASLLVLSRASSFEGLVSLAFLAGLTAELYKPASSALLADLSEERDRVAVYAAYRLAINAGWSIGPAVAGLLAQQSYIWLFAGDAATAALFGVIALFLLPGKSPARKTAFVNTKEFKPGLLAALRVASRDLPFVRLLAATLAISLAFVQMPTTLGLQMAAAGRTEAVYGLILALNGLIVVLFELPIASWSARLAPRPIMAVGYGLIGAGTLAYAWAQSAWGFAFGMAVFTFGETLCMPVAMAYVARRAPPSLRGCYLGFYGLTWSVALTLGPWIGAAVFAWWPPALWIGCGLLGWLGAAIILWPVHLACQPQHSTT